MSFEESLIRNASPTLASIKVANLYNFKFDSMEECNRTIGCFNLVMNPKGIFIELMKHEKDFYLIYVYRRSQLLSKLKEDENKNFLSGYGYAVEEDLQGYLNFLKERLGKEKSFPHEIGVFLGYPLPDIKSFIEMQGRKSLLCGEWKVYHDEETAKCLFCKYLKCKEIYQKVYEGGKNFCEMVVSA